MVERTFSEHLELLRQLGTTGQTAAEVMRRQAKDLEKIGMTLKQWRERLEKERSGG